MGWPNGPLTQFGADPDSWNLGDPDFGSEEEDGSGLPGARMVAVAISVWCNLQARPNVTVEEVALTFNMTPECVREAVAAHYWMCLEGNMIMHEGA